MKANSGMRAKAVPRDISSRKQDVPAPGDGAASEWLRSYLQESIRPPRLAIWPAYRESFASQRSSHCLVG